MGRAKVIPPNTLLLPYQVKWVEDEARLKIAEKPRQVGWTWATGYGLVRRKSLVTTRLDAWISSRDDIQARLFLEDCKGFAGLLKLGAEDLGQRVIDEAKNSAHILGMANGLRIHSMSSNPDAQAGKRGDRVLDEFALHPDPRKLYTIAYPGITWGGSLEIFSTHRGSANFFNQLIIEIVEKGNPKGFSYHRVTLQDALEQGFLVKLQAKLPPDDARQEMDEAEYFEFIRRGCPDEESFLQEYMCQPQDDNTCFISYDLMDRCKYSGSDWQTVGIGDCYMGVDIARESDYTVFWVVEHSAGGNYTRHVSALQKTEWDKQEAELHRLMEAFKVRRCCIDKTGIGNQFAERARKKYGPKVEGVTFTAAIKEEMAYAVKSQLEDATLRIPDDRTIYADFRSIKKLTTSAGNIRFDAEKTKAGHGDRFWALGLALHAKGNGKSLPFRPRTFNFTTTTHL